MLVKWFFQISFTEVVSGYLNLHQTQKVYIKMMYW